MKRIDGMRLLAVRLLAFAFSLTSLAAGWAQTKGKPKVGTVEIEVVDGLGGKLLGGEIKSFTNRRTGEDFARRFRPNRFLEETATIPYGHYVVRVAQPGFPDAERPVDVFTPDSSVDVCVRTATVHIVDVGYLKDIEVRSFKSREDDFDLAKNFQHNIATRVPYGIYDLRVAHDWARQAERRVDVFQDDVWVVLELELAPIDLPEYRSPKYVVEGTINNIDPNDEPIYVSLVGVHANFRIDDKVDVSGTSGTFMLAGFNPLVKLLLITTGQKGILDIREVYVLPEKPIVIDLAHKNQPQ